MPYLIKDGKIQSNTCEINVTLHCNFSCRGCVHMSPVSPKYNIRPEDALRDLSILAKYYEVRCVGLLGGEPLLHPSLEEIIDSALKSGISNHIKLFTNGVLLKKMKEELWEKIDEIYISLYPGKEISRGEIEECYNKGARYDTEIKLNFADIFFEPFSEMGTENKNLVKRIYDSCLMVNFLRCHTVYEGYFYKCPQALFIPMFLKNDDFPTPTIDGIKIEEREGFKEYFLNYLESDKPLASCKYCTGFVGKRFLYKEISRKEWWIPQKYPLEDMIEDRVLNMLEWLLNVFDHSKFIKNEIIHIWPWDEFHLTFFGQIFYMEGQKLSATHILFTIESIFSIQFSIIWEHIMWQITIFR